MNTLNTFVDPPEVHLDPPEVHEVTLPLTAEEAEALSAMPALMLELNALHVQLEGIAQQVVDGWQRRQELYTELEKHRNRAASAIHRKLCLMRGTSYTDEAVERLEVIVKELKRRA